ncbi:sulfatase-like hydrolase/transferase [Aliiglaciecola lipolytica]|uniref:sulfatase-like hydrolase/transferase n=1 Tax=Aliiglaciecola lipolytica TaxID=477689 RepID=UPI001C083ACD|nr:sulfatase-like hydrolase/transferase [Aliiglaciecola lipolytica]MBU2877915.1 sulfatase-like hydrolase/transferase [Aliiglaciecola lipolytica]
MSRSPIYLKINHIFVTVIFGLNLIYSVNSQASAKTNVLFILTDDQSYNTVHALGNKRIATPNIDSLAQQGTAFTHVFNQGSWSGAVCAPSRRMINTGRHLYQTGRGPEKLPAETQNEIKLMGETFKDHGYQSFMTGKWHLSKEDWQTSFAQGKAIFMGGMARLKHGGQFNANFVDYHPTAAANAKFSTYKADKHTSEVIADAAVEFLAEKHDKPFMMYVGFLAPHDPRQAPQSYVGKYPADSIALADNFLTTHPFNQGDFYIRDEILANNPRNPSVIKQFIGDYYAMIEHTDAQIGRILAALKASGQSNNTLIVFTSDHGLAVGSHGLLGKQNQYDHSVRAPFIVKGPNIPKGKSMPGMFYLNSVFPSVVELVGLDIPKSVQAASIAPLIRGEKTQLYQSIYGSYRHFQRMLRTQDYKLIYYPVLRKTQLFDLINDPYETENLADLAEHQSRIKQMMLELEKWKKIVNDPLDNNDPIASFGRLVNTEDSDKRPDDWPKI